ncbi:hypothetical protein I4I73_02115 [Pseudonocardia sp. KRD-184]|uniref:Uncharacterized protein n=1 Tax=Pseudonocardia oceani TaxID=2792013 RepID=A0ABS6U9W3_9PSEU|nr:hypothetical protein [Pseudonocardia oceani]MBW0089663.1 hypothetical protein [Pseudonocardia oceani]MBW0094793.1 hypothetical protein [Pseudonocardia oceani]MBW0123554.1 hypothetical protein [Pseudonocardia oceani]MBW0129025.1 hypothetical protein [Pseudonocardia oceani]
MDLGSVPDWISAIATVGALVAAVVAGWAAYQQLTMLKNDARKRQRLEDQADAAGVAIWVRVGTKDKLPLIRYINRSGMPIFELTVWIDTPDHRFRIYRTVAGPAFDTREMRQGTTELRAIAARLNYEPDWNGLLDETHLRCASRFRDSANKWWFRDFNGTLSGAKEKPGAPQRHGESNRNASDEGIGVAG